MATEHVSSGFYFSFQCCNMFMVNVPCYNNVSNVGQITWQIKYCCFNNHWYVKHKIIESNKGPSGPSSPTSYRYMKPNLRPSLRCGIFTLDFFLAIYVLLFNFIVGLDTIDHKQKALSPVLPHIFQAFPPMIRPKDNVEAALNYSKNVP